VASVKGRHKLVLLHGWGCTPEIWRSVLPGLRPWADITLIDLASCLDAVSAPQDDFSALLSVIMSRTPQYASYVGWSLGGSIATALAAKFPERVCSLLTMCSNPKFIGTSDWPGMSAASFSTFAAESAIHPAKALRRFDLLQTQGAKDERWLRCELAAVHTRLPRDTSTLLLQLNILGEVDHRALLTQLTQPQLHLFTERDELVPQVVCDQLTAVLRSTDNARCHSLGNHSHLVPLELPQQMAKKITDFVRQQGLFEDSGILATLPAKREIGRSFSLAAQRYDSVAGLQRDVGDRLLDDIRFDEGLPSTVLDLGCGTGYFYSQLTQLGPNIDYLGLDLAAGMVEFARDRFPGEGQWLVGDAEQLPLAANSVDLVFSSLAIQWCSSPHRVFAELARVLRPGGQCVFTSLGPETLRELRDSWASVDDYQHVNNFISSAVLQDAAAQVPGIVMTVREQSFAVQYERVSELLRELKVLGAHNMNRGRAEGLTTKVALQAMYKSYEQWRSQGKLPATYDVQFGMIEKHR
jgi:malonyl-CoA O-methyltransferase